MFIHVSKPYPAGGSYQDVRVGHRYRRVTQKGTLKENANAKNQIRVSSKDEHQ